MFGGAAQQSYRKVDPQDMRSLLELREYRSELKTTIKVQLNSRNYHGKLQKTKTNRKKTRQKIKKKKKNQQRTGEGRGAIISGA
jgi:hypothetical protein